MPLVLHGQFPLMYVHCSLQTYRSCRIRRIHHQRRQRLLSKGISHHQPDSHDIGKEARRVREYATHMKLMVRYSPYNLCRPSGQQTCAARP